jgi:hypothetical protein
MYFMLIEHREALQGCAKALRSRESEAAVSTNHPETPASVTIGALGYRARCTEAGCGNLARWVFRYAGAGGRPINNLQFCYAHARERLARNRAAGLKIYDDREIRSSTRA